MFVCSYRVRAAIAVAAVVVVAVAAAAAACAVDIATFAVPSERSFVPRLEFNFVRSRKKETTKNK